MNCRRNLFGLLFALLASSAIAAEPFAAGAKVGDEWTDSHQITFCWCPPGRIRAGGVDEEIPHGFWMAKYELTCGQVSSIDRSFRVKAPLAGDPDHPLEARRWERICLACSKG